MAYERLTDRQLAAGVNLTDLIHIVDPTDTSQNPAGSSYKATLSQVATLIAIGITWEQMKEKYLNEVGR